MPLAIVFEPRIEDGYDNERCSVIVDGNGFRGEARFTNRDPVEFAELERAVATFPLIDRLRCDFFNGLFMVAIEPIASLGDLRLELRLAAEMDRTEVRIDTSTNYAALVRFAGELRILIEQDVGKAEL